MVRLSSVELLEERMEVIEKSCNLLLLLEGVWVWVWIEALLVPFSPFELALVVRSEHSAQPSAAIGGGALSKKLGVSMPPRRPGLL